MYDKNAASIDISIDTIYGFIFKRGLFHVKNISTADILDKYLTHVFNTIKTAIIEDFKQMEKVNKIEVLDDR